MNIGVTIDGVMSEFFGTDALTEAAENGVFEEFEENFNVVFSSGDGLGFCESGSDNGGTGAVGAVSVTVTETDDGHRISITDSDSTESFEVKNGKDGADGEKGDTGERGSDGVSPQITVTSISGGHRVTVTDSNGEKSFDVMDGSGSSGGGSDGRGILSFERTSGDGGAGSVDTYTIKYTDGTESVFSVYNGRDGCDGTAASLTREAVEAVLTGDITTHTHSGYLTSHQDISGKLDRSGGALSGAVTAHLGNDYTAYRIRNIAVKTSAETPPDGALLGVYVN